MNTISGAGDAGAATHFRAITARQQEQSAITDRAANIHNRPLRFPQPTNTVQTSTLIEPAPGDSVEFSSAAKVAADTGTPRPPVTTDATPPIVAEAQAEATTQLELLESIAPPSQKNNDTPSLGPSPDLVDDPLADPVYAEPQTQGAETPNTEAPASEFEPIETVETPTDPTPDATDVVPQESAVDEEAEETPVENPEQEPEKTGVAKFFDDLFTGIGNAIFGTIRTYDGPVGPGQLADEFGEAVQESARNTIGSYVRDFFTGLFGGLFGRR